MSIPADLVSLRVDRSGPVAEVVLTGPGRGNAMGPDFWREAPLVFTALDEDPEVRAVIGLDLPAMLPDITGTLGKDGGLAGARTDFYDLIRRMQRAADSVEECRKPVIAAIAGWCIGGGVDIMAAADVRLASADAQFSVREVKVAIVADMGSLQRLPGIIGEGWTRRLALTGEDVTAAQALQMGLVTSVFDSPDALLEAARELAAEIAANPPLVVQGTKRVLNVSRDLSRKDALEHVAVWNAAFLASHDLTEALTAFMERRPPEFQGR